MRPGPSDVSRRQFLASTTVAAGATLTGTPAPAAPVMLAQAAPAATVVEARN